MSGRYSMHVSVKLLSSNARHAMQCHATPCLPGMQPQRHIRADVPSSRFHFPSQLSCPKENKSISHTYNAYAMCRYGGKEAGEEKA